jgi:hypothetical protein
MKIKVRAPSHFRRLFYALLPKAKIKSKNLAEILLFFKEKTGIDLTLLFGWRIIIV